MVLLMNNGCGSLTNTLRLVRNPSDHTHILCHLNCSNVISTLLAGRRERLECVGCTTDELWLWVLN